MKKLTTLLLLCSLVLPIKAQTDTTKTQEVPEFPGGETELINFIKTNLKYPEKAKTESISGMCLIGFVVEKDGSISDVKTINGVPNCPECDQEAMRVVASMPKWKPGKYKGEIVRVAYNLPINFKITELNIFGKEKKKKKK